MGIAILALAVDKAQARAWYERSAAARDPKGMGTFGEYLLNGIGGPQDKTLGLVNVTEAAHLGSDMGACILGEVFFRGVYGLPKDPVRARFWLKVVEGECEFKHLYEDCVPLAANMLAVMDAAE